MKLEKQLSENLKYIKNKIEIGEGEGFTDNCYGYRCPFEPSNRAILHENKKFRKFFSYVNGSTISCCAQRAYALCKFLGWNGTLRDFIREFVEDDSLLCDLFFEKFPVKIKITDRNIKI
jgi:hypothetical protein